MWSPDEIEKMCSALKRFGTSVSRIARELNYSRSPKQVLQKLINMKKWPHGFDPAIIKIIIAGHLSIKT